jgi:hypothetical protein
MAHYDDDLTLRDARRIYFDANGFGADGGYHDAWVRFDLGPLPVAFPNTPSRVRAVRFHDLHHIATGYETTTVGEGEIAAWELGGGCADHYAAWLLNVVALPLPLLLAPRRLLRAFVRGRRGANLYRRTYDDALLGLTVRELRRELGADVPPTPATPRDLVAFAAAFAAGAFLGVPVGLAMPAMGVALAAFARLRPEATAPTT